MDWMGLDIVDHYYHQSIASSANNDKIFLLGVIHFGFKTWRLLKQCSRNHPVVFHVGQDDGMMEEESTNPQECDVSIPIQLN